VVLTAGLGALSTPGTSGALLTECRARPAPATSQWLRPCTPPALPTARSSVLRGINEGSRDSPVRSAPHPWPSRWDEDPFGFTLELRTPPLPAAHAKGRARQRARARDYTTDITSALLTASPLAKCDIVSQRQIRMVATFHRPAEADGVNRRESILSPGVCVPLLLDRMEDRVCQGRARSDRCGIPHEEALLRSPTTGQGQRPSPWLARGRRRQRP